MSIFQDLFGCQQSIFRKCEPVSFRRNVMSSKFLIEKYELKGKLVGHSGCVNSVLYSDGAKLIYTGSDDTNVNIYDSETLRRVDRVATIHTNNIFYAKDLPGTDMDIMVTCAADGRVAVMNMTTKSSRRLYRHQGRAHRIGLVPFESNQFYSCGEDGACCMFDLRDGGRTLFQETNGASALVEDVSTPVMTTQFKNNRGRKSSIYTVGVNPLKNYEVAVAGSSNHIALYDSRRFMEPVSYLCPRNLASSTAHVTGLKYDHTGQVLIGSYNDEDVYSFFVDENALPERRTSDPMDSAASAAVAAAGTGSGGDDDGDEDISPTAVQARGYYRKYFGHRNNNTVKQVGFMGGRSDYVISGSDCGHIFIWDTHSAQLVQMLKADDVGAINCLASHPYLPVLATSGLENDAKVWAPTGEHRPLLEGSVKKRSVDQVVARNAERNAEAGEAYSNTLLNLLMGLINRGDLPLHGGSSDEDEGDDDESGEGSEESGGSVGSEGREDMDEDESEDGDWDGDRGESDSEQGQEQEQGAGSHTRYSAAGDTGTRGNRWRRRPKTAAAGPNRSRDDHNAEEEEEEGDDEVDGGEGGREGVGGGEMDGGECEGSGEAEEEEEEVVEEGPDSESEMDVDGSTVSASDIASGRVGILIDGVPVSWNQLARLLPRMLGRRRRSPGDTGDEAKAEDAEEARRGFLRSQGSQQGESPDSQQTSQDGSQGSQDGDVPDLEVDPDADV